MKITFLILFKFLSFSHENELSVALDLFKELNIHHCIFLDRIVDNIEKMLNNIKILSSKNVACTVMHGSNLAKYLYFKRDYFKVGIIATDENFNELNILSQIFDDVSIP